MDIFDILIAIVDIAVILSGGLVVLSLIVYGIGPIDRLRELVEADRAGRVKILSSTTGMTCGACDHFKRIPGTCRGRCSERPYCRNKYGHTDERRGEFTPSQSRIACKMFDRRKWPEMPDISGMSEEDQKLYRDILSGNILKGE